MLFNEDFRLRAVTDTSSLVQTASESVALPRVTIKTESFYTEKNYLYSDKTNVNNRLVFDAGSNAGELLHLLDSFDNEQDKANWVTSFFTIIEYAKDNNNSDTAFIAAATTAGIDIKDDYVYRDDFSTGQLVDITTNSAVDIRTVIKFTIKLNSIEYPFSIYLDEDKYVADYEDVTFLSEYVMSAFTPAEIIAIDADPNDNTNYATTMSNWNTMLSSVLNDRATALDISGIMVVTDYINGVLSRPIHFGVPYKGKVDPSDTTAKRNSNNAVATYIKEIASDDNISDPDAVFGRLLPVIFATQTYYYVPTWVLGEEASTFDIGSTIENVPSHILNVNDLVNAMKELELRDSEVQILEELDVLLAPGINYHIGVIAEFNGAEQLDSMYPMYINQELVDSEVYTAISGVLTYGPDTLTFVQSLSSVVSLSSTIDFGSIPEANKHTTTLADDATVIKWYKFVFGGKIHCVLLKRQS